MMTDEPVSTNRKKAAPIPDYLIYEIDEGKPIYYRGYKEVIKKTKTLEDIMGCSIIQSLVIMLISDFLKEHLPANYIRLSNELGLKLSGKSRRNLDLAIYDKNKLADRSVLLSNQYAQMPPQIVFEVDTRADMSAFETPADYYHRKTQQLLDFGVEKVIWVFTGSRKYLFAEPDKKWTIGNWSDEMELLPGLALNLELLLETV